MRKKAASKTKPLYRQPPPVGPGGLRRAEAPTRGRRGGRPTPLRETPMDLRPVGSPRCVELFAGAGGLAIAAANAGFEHAAVLEFNHDACETIRSNQRRGYELVRHWPLIESDVHHHDFSAWRGRCDLVSGGPPCQPFSIGGKHGAMGDRRK